MSDFSCHISLNTFSFFRYHHLAHQMDQSLNSHATNLLSAETMSDARSTSVAELRRKAQEHSAALLHSLHHAVAGLSFPLHFPIPFHHALNNNRTIKNGHFGIDYSNEVNFQLTNNNNNSLNDNNIISKIEHADKPDLKLDHTSKNCVGDD